MNNIIDWLQNWTMSQIDGDWEHELGISIRMLDNPGWLLSADISNYFDFGWCFKKYDTTLDIPIIDIKES